MPAELTLLVGGHAWSTWTSVEIDGDYLVPSDGWTVTARTPDPTTLLLLQLGQPVLLQAGSVVVLRGVLESIHSHRSRDGGVTITLAGRDLAGAMVDCGPGPSWGWPTTTLLAAAQQAILDLGLPVIVEAATEAMVPRAIMAEVGESYWEVLDRYARKARLGLWMSPLGVLQIGRPDYVAVPVGTIVHAQNRATRGTTNVLEARYVQDVAGRRSPVSVVGQAGATAAVGASALSAGLALDPVLATLGLVRPLVIDDAEVGSFAEATARARFEVSRRAFQAERLDVVVQGALATPTTAWAPNQLVGVQDDVHGLLGTWWVRSRRIVVDRSQGTRTALSLHPPNLYLPAV